MSANGRKNTGVEFRCADVGVGCKNVARAGSEQDLLTAVAAHAREAHGVELNETLIDYARSKVRGAGTRTDG